MEKRYLIVVQGTTAPILQKLAKVPLAFDDKEKAEETCRRMNGSLDPPGSLAPDPPYLVLDRG